MKIDNYLYIKWKIKNYYFRRCVINIFQKEHRYTNDNTVADNLLKNEIFMSKYLQ